MPNMKTKLALFSIVAALTVSAQTDSVHNWTLQSGAVFSGDYFSSGSQMVVIKSHGTNCILKISELSTNDWLFFYQCKMNQRQMQLDAEAKQMVAAGIVEATVNLFRDFPEKVSDKGCWMDAKFIKVDSSNLAYPDVYLGFRVEDKNGDECYNCAVIKEFPGENFKNGTDYSDKKANPLVGVVMNLKPGDKVRLIGKKLPIFDIEKIEMIESAADAAAVKKVKRDLEN